MILAFSPVGAHPMRQRLGIAFRGICYLRRRGAPMSGERSRGNIIGRIWVLSH